MASLYGHFLFPRWQAQAEMAHPYTCVIQPSEPSQLKPLACLVLGIYTFLAPLVLCILRLITSQSASFFCLYLSLSSLIFLSRVIWSMCFINPNSFLPQSLG